MNTQSNDPLLGGGADSMNLLQEEPPSVQELRQEQEVGGGKGLPPCFVLEGQEDGEEEEVDWSKEIMFN